MLDGVFAEGYAEPAIRQRYQTAARKDHALQRLPKTSRSRMKLKFPVDLDRDAVREFGKPDGGARVLAVLRTQQFP